MNISDEKLNKYLDGELDENEAVEVKLALISSEETKRRFTALRLVHEKLHLLKEDEVSLQFTETVMKKIGESYAVPKSQKYFILSISAFITLICLVILGYVISAILSSPSGSESQPVIDTLSQKSSELITYTKNLFTGKSLSIVGSIFSLIIMISGYFFFEMQKKGKAKLSS